MTSTAVNACSGLLPKSRESRGGQGRTRGRRARWLRRACCSGVTFMLCRACARAGVRTSAGTRAHTRHTAERFREMKLGTRHRSELTTRKGPMPAMVHGLGMELLGGGRPAATSMEILYVACWSNFCVSSCLDFRREHFFERARPPPEQNPGRKALQRPPGVRGTRAPVRS